MKKKVDIIVRTYNSESTLANCLKSVIELLPFSKIIVIDHYSKDRTREIANDYNCQIFLESEGLGRATMLGIEKSSSEVILFIDSDIIVKRGDFVDLAVEYLKNPGVGAVVGMSEGHKFSYGLPLGMTMFLRSSVENVHIPAAVMSRETYYIQRLFRERGLKVKYVPNSNIHISESRKYTYWPEWQGSWVRLTSGLNPREFIYSMMVVFLLLSNSRNVKNFLYFPIFQIKLLRGFLQPKKWSKGFRESNFLLEENKVA
jgi:glycosyltransferase involved in cell wall biosynthesis